MKTMTPVFWALAALLLLPVAAPAWSGTAHQVIAAEAYRELSPALQKKALQALKAHPQYQQWEGSFHGNAGNPEFGLQIFMRASTWPDEIRHTESKHSHPKWHFINYPLKPSGFPFVPDSSPENDILFAIQKCEQDLSNRKAPPEERAVCLSWLIHLIGDLHQPLHCSSLFDRAHPNGDRGGNDFFVKPAAQGIPLHSFWDGLLGTSGKAQSHLNYAIALQSEHPRKSLKPLKKARTAKDWSIENRSLAVESVYLHGKLKGGINREAAPDLPSGYTKAAKAVAETQAALAGYRLADEIRNWMK